MIGKFLEKRIRKWTPRWHPFRFKATLIGMVVAAILIPLAVLAIPYLEILNDMAVQPKGKAQGHYGWFSDQAIVVERPPVEGTMPMAGYVPYRIDDEDPEVAAQRAGEILVNAERRTMEVLQRGQKIFETICIVCHGPQAEGDGKIVGPDLFPAPPTLHSPQALDFPDGRIFHVITKGQNKMPSYADQLDPAERWAVVHYIRVLQQMMQSDDGEGDR